MASLRISTYQSWFMLFAVGMLVFVMNIDYTAVNLALVPISLDVNGDLNALQWLLSGYVLTWGALVIPTGRLSDLYGKKKPLIAGVLIFILGSIITGEGNSIEALIGGRILQGLGAALFSSPAYGLIFTSVPASKQGMAMGVIGGAAGFGLALGPTLAGWIINTMSWRWIFYINVPLGLIVITILILYAPQEKLSDTAKINWLTAGLLAFGLGSVVFALNQIEIWGGYDMRLWGMMIAGATALLVFRYLDRWQSVQMMPQSLLENKPFMAAVANGFFISYCFALTMVMMGLYLQNTMKLSSVQTGEMFLVMTLILGVLSIVGGKLVDRMDIRIPTVSGPLFIMAALLILCSLGAHSSLWMVGGGLFLVGLGLGICFPSMNTAMFRTVSADSMNTGSAMFTMVMLLANSLSVIISTSLLVIAGRTYLLKMIAQGGQTLTAQETQILVNTVTKFDHTAAQLRGLPEDKIPEFLTLVNQAFLSGYQITLCIGSVFAALAAWVAFRYFGSVAKPSSSEEAPLPMIA